MSKVESVLIGYDSDHKTTIAAIHYYADKMASDGDGEVLPQDIINAFTPATVIGIQKWWVIELALDTDNIEAMTTQQVESGDADSRVIREDAHPDPIGYFVVNGKDTGGNAVVYTFESGKTYYAGSKGKFSNREGTERQLSIYTFVCIGTRAVS